jgi:hypothetical protein
MLRMIEFRLDQALTLDMYALVFTEQLLLDEVIDDEDTDHVEEIDEGDTDDDEEIEGDTDHDEEIEEDTDHDEEIDEGDTYHVEEMEEKHTLTRICLSFQ